MMANDFLTTHGTNAATVMTALDAALIPASQDWDNETTTWTFIDGSQIVVSGSHVTAVA
jgi:hypothetical protein